MARTLEYWQDIMLSKKQSFSNLSDLEVLTTNETQNLQGLTSTSKVALWRLWIYIVAFCAFALDKLFDVFKQEVDATVAQNKVHNFLWYKEKALAFQYGDALVYESDYYNNDGKTISDIEQSKIVKRAAVIRKIANGKGFLELKVAKLVGGVLQPLTEQELEAFSSYMFNVSDAGTYIVFVSLPPDDLKLDLEIFYDPQILWSDGSRKDGTNDTPIQGAINDYLQNLEFNGEFTITGLVDYLQKTEGVKIPKVITADSKFGAFDYSNIYETYIARAGYMTLDIQNTTIKYTARNV